MAGVSNPVAKERFVFICGIHLKYGTNFVHTFYLCDAFPTSSQGPSATSVPTTSQAIDGSPTPEPRGRNEGILVVEILGPVLGVLLIVILWPRFWRRRTLSRLPGATDSAPEAPDPNDNDHADEPEHKKQGPAYLDGNPIS